MQNLSWCNFRKICSEVPITITFVPRTGGDMEWVFDGNTSLISQHQSLVIVEDLDWTMLLISDVLGP